MSRERQNAKLQRFCIKLVVGHKIHHLDVDAMQESSIQMIQGVSQIPFSFALALERVLR